MAGAEIEPRSGNFNKLEQSKGKYGPIVSKELFPIIPSPEK
jgi:hypothetical protein